MKAPGFHKEEELIKIISLFYLASIANPALS